jgi:uncharacterized RDD family membrane protein YckC
MEKSKAEAGLIADAPISLRNKHKSIDLAVWRSRGILSENAMNETSPIGATGSVPISSEHPGFWLRVAAHLIDTVLLYAVVVIGAFFIGFIIGFVMALAQVKGGLVTVLAGMAGGAFGLIISWLYYALMESSPYQATLGKMALGFVVTDMEGRRISFAKATGRYFGMILSAIILCIGYIMCAFTEKKQCLHDILVGCLMYKKQ